MAHTVSLASPGHEVPGDLNVSKDFEQLLAQLAWADPRSPSARANRPISRDLQTLIMQCLQKAQDERPNGMGTLIGALESVDVAGDWDGHKARDWWLDHADDLLTRPPG